MTPEEQLRGRVVLVVLAAVITLAGALYGLVGALLLTAGTESVPDALWLAAGTQSGVIGTWLVNSKGVPKHDA